jgi:hypothetical protein
MFPIPQIVNVAIAVTDSPVTLIPHLDCTVPQVVLQDWLPDHLVFHLNIAASHLSIIGMNSPFSCSYCSYQTGLRC